MRANIGDPRSHLIALEDCVAEPVRRVGRKAALLGWASANDITTPGGLVVPADRLTEALSAAGGLERVRYLEQSALRLDPGHSFDIAASIAAALRSPAVEALATADAEAALDRLGVTRVVCRSSSALEDQSRAAFPGVFLSVLDIDGPDRLATAITDCWRSAFSVDAMRYLLRMRVEPVDFSLALLVQGQVDAPWFGVYVSVDPLTGDAEPQADLSNAGPVGVVSGQRVPVRARRRDGRWTGLDDAPFLAAPLEVVHRAANRLADRLGEDVDVEFAVPDDGEPVILQCRPLTAVDRRRRPRDDAPAIVGQRIIGRACAGERVVGTATDPRHGVSEGPHASIAVVDQLTTADYDIVFRHAGVVMEEDTSSLSHVAILCRELGVTLVCAVADARSLLVGRQVAVDGGTGEVEILAGATEAMPGVADGPPTEVVLSAVELLLRVLVGARPGRPPAEEVVRIATRCAHDLGQDSILVVGHDVAAGELAQIEAIGTQLFGAGFTAAEFLAEFAGRRLPAA